MAGQLGVIGSAERWKINATLPFFSYAANSTGDQCISYILIKARPLIFGGGDLSLEHISFLWQTAAAGAPYHSL